MISPNSDPNRTANNSTEQASPDNPGQDGDVGSQQTAKVNDSDDVTVQTSDADAAEQGDEGKVVEPIVLNPMQELESTLAESEGRLRAVSKAYTDLQQDMAGFRKRVEEQGRVKRDLKAFETVKTFFEPVQNLRRSLQNHGDDMAMLVEGLRLILAQFDNGLTDLGLAEVPGEGALFNPEYHEALAMSPVPDPSLDGKVIMVHTAGYLVNGKVLQASQVIVGQYTEEETPEA